MRIYGLMGKKKAGKDLFCTIAQKNLFMTPMAPEIHRYAFADALKEFAIDYLGVPQEACFGTQEQKLKVIGKFGDFLNPAQFEEYSADQEMTGRLLLQLVGTEIFRRNFKSTIWIDLVLRRIQKASECVVHGRENIAIITDARFKNEFDAIKSAGGKMIRLFRHTDDVKDQHASEKEMDTIPKLSFDYLIRKQDNVNIDDLTQMVGRIFKTEGLL